MISSLDFTYDLPGDGARLADGLKQEGALSLYSSLAEWADSASGKRRNK